MKRFPQYAQTDLYLSGESYAGHYVPNLALEIVHGNKRAPTATATAAAAAATGEEAGGGSSAVAASPGKGYLNLKGFFVGNAWTDPAIDNRGGCVRTVGGVPRRGGGEKREHTYMFVRQHVKSCSSRGTCRGKGVNLEGCCEMRAEVKQNCRA
jgi:hypothetical protein